MRAPRRRPLYGGAPTIRVPRSTGRTRRIAAGRRGGDCAAGSAGRKSRIRPRGHGRRRGLPARHRVRDRARGIAGRSGRTDHPQCPQAGAPRDPPRAGQPGFRLTQARACCSKVGAGFERLEHAKSAGYTPTGRQSDSSRSRSICVSRCAASASSVASTASPHRTDPRPRPSRPETRRETGRMRTARADRCP